MDGISSASAVVSLAVQLISTVRDVVNFLREIQDSPEELRCTIAHLEQLRNIFEVVKGLVDAQDACVDLPSSVLLIDALRTCESHINLVEVCVNKFKRVVDRQSPIRKKWAAFKHVLKKGEIQKFQDHLHRAIGDLQIALITNSSALVLRDIKNTAAMHESLFSVLNNQPLPAQKGFLASPNLHEEETLSSSDKFANFANFTHVNAEITSDSTLWMRDTQRPIAGLKGNSENNSKQSSLTKHESLPGSRCVSKESMLHWYSGILGNVSLRTRLKFVDDTLNVHIVGKQFVSEEYIIVFRPSFMKNQFELRSIKRYSHISRTLSTECVVSFKAPVFAMCRSGDIKALQDASRSNSASLHVVDPLGMGLLHYAAGSFHKDLCSWLLNMDVSADRTNVLGNNALTYMGTRSKIDQTGAVTKSMIETARLLAQAQKDFSAFDISMWFREYDGPPEGAKLILSQDLAQYYICSADDSDPLYPALASILRLYAKNSQSWESVLRTLIRYGADIHAPVRRDLTYLDQSEYTCPLAKYGTPLDELFMYTLDPFEGQVAANGWLHILESEGHNVSAYLEKESALHVRPMQLTHPSYRTMAYDNERKLVFHLESHPTVSWDWWISPSSSTCQLREEFRIMAITAPDCLLITSSWKVAWPFRFPVWSELHQYCGDAKYRLRYKKLLDHADAHAAKRVERKARKTAWAQRTKGPRNVPGAWPT